MPHRDLLMTGRNQLHGKNYSEFLPWVCLDLVTGSLAWVLTTNRHSVKSNCAIRFRRGHTVKLFFDTGKLVPCFFACRKLAWEVFLGGKDQLFRNQKGLNAQGFRHCMMCLFHLLPFKQPGGMVISVQHLLLLFGWSGLSQADGDKLKVFREAWVQPKKDSDNQRFCSLHFLQQQNTRLFLSMEVTIRLELVMFVLASFVARSKRGLF